MPDEHTYVAGVAPTATTAEQLLRANLRDKRAELVRGVVRVREPAGYRHGRLTMMGRVQGLEGEDVLPGFACALADIVQE